MREILFRGKPVNKAFGDEFIYGSLGVINEGLVAIYNCLEFTEDIRYLVIPETVGQYTGLTDKKGNKIFEGDIVKDKFLFGVVKYATANDGFDGMCGFMVDDIDDGLQDYNGFWHRVEVIGNIYDNPELLKGE